MNYNLDKFVDRNGTNSAKWEAMNLMEPNADDTTLPFWVADMDFPCSQPILEALNKRIDRKIFGYSVMPSGDFYRAVIGWYLHRFDWYVNSSDIFYSIGIVPALSYLVEILSEPDENVLIQRPVYYPFTNVVLSNNRKVVSNSLINTNGYYTIDFVDFEEKASDPKTKLFILCHPHNPVGRVWNEIELKKMADICKKHNVTIVSDEIHYDLIRSDKKHTPLVKLCPEYKDLIVTCTAPSKTFNLAGAQMSNIIIHNKDIQKKWSDYVISKLHISMPTPFAIEATKAAYTLSEDWLLQVNNYLDENLKMMKEFLEINTPKVKFEIPEGTYLCWIDVRDYKIDHIELCDSLIRYGKVFFEDGILFGEEGKGFLRVNVSCTRETLLTGLQRFAGVLNRIVAGSKIPNFIYSTQLEQNKDFYETISKNEKTYIMFLRYYGCTICQYELYKLKKDYDSYKKIGITPIVVLQSSPDLVKEITTNKDIPFDIICDPKQEIYKLYNVFPAINPKDMVNLSVLGNIKAAMELGFTHGKYEGNEMQLPAGFVVDKNANVIYAKYASSLDMTDINNEILSLK